MSPYAGAAGYHCFLAVPEIPHAGISHAFFAYMDHNWYATSQYAVTNHLSASCTIPP
jgi:hypothetical protein